MGFTLEDQEKEKAADGKEGEVKSNDGISPEERKKCASEEKKVTVVSKKENVAEVEKEEKYDGSREQIFHQAVSFFRHVIP